ncbi:MAG: hypothetical protein AB8B65_11130 [Kordia sp.]|uniref:hypothetical protein n=1 Tax=Kordia sp. TaxID=1965332 RepID=UPI00385F6DDC
MIIYGTGSKKIGIQKIQGAKCQNCGATEMYAQGVSRYIYLFWIPMFPYKKKFITICNHCKQVLEKKEMPQQLTDKLALEKHHFKTPFYLFSGSLLLVLFVLWGFYQSGEHNKKLMENVKNLQANDIIAFKVARKEYSFAEIDERRNDTLFIHYGNYTHNGYRPSESKMADLVVSETDFFDTEIYYFTQKQIDSLHAKGEIAEIYNLKK